MTTTEPARTADDAARDYIVLKVLADQVKEAIERVQAEAKDALKVGARWPAQLPDGTKIGGVTYAEGSKGKAYVANEHAFTSWVRDNFPTEIETVTRVRPAYQSRVLDEVTAQGGRIDAATGEISDVPGVDIAADGTAFITHNKARGAAELVAQAWRAGVLSPLRAIEGGDAA